MKRLGDAEFTVVANGHEPVDGTLAALDLTQLPNDFYVFRLTARDIGRRLARAETVVELRSAEKFGYFHAETDLAVTLAGVPVTVTRAYDSTRADRQGKFGQGWRFLGRELDVRDNVLPTGYEAQGLYHPYEVGTRLYLSTPAGDELGFAFDPVRVVTPGPVYYAPAWDLMADSAAGWTLSTPDLRLMKAGSLFFDLTTAFPYNPHSPFFSGADFVLTGPDGTRYGVDAALGVVSITSPAGSTVYVGDSGLTATTGETIQFIYDGAGRIERMVAPDGDVTLYSYDAQGDLAAVRDLATGDSRRYGYDPAVPHRLTAAVDATGTGTAVVYASGAIPTTAPIAGNLGAAVSFLGQAFPGTLAAGAADRYAFSIRASEVASTPHGELFVRVVVLGDAGGVQPAVPEIAGLTPRSTFAAAGRAEALFAVTREGLYAVTVGSIAGTSGGYTLQVQIAGDINGDGTVDGLDTGLMAAAQGSREGDAGYLLAADLDGNGVIESADSLILARNYGFRANAAPQANPDLEPVLTHVDLGVRIPLDSALIDLDGDSIVFQLAGADRGTAALGADGRFVLFVPEAGYSGPASVSVTADDGFSVSGVTVVSIDVSAAPLLRMDIVNRGPHLGPGGRDTLDVVGDFADQAGVPLIGNYLSYTSSNETALTVDEFGNLRGLAEGYAAATARRGKPGGGDGGHRRQPGRRVRPGRLRPGRVSACPHPAASWRPAPVPGHGRGRGRLRGFGRDDLSGWRRLRCNGYARRSRGFGRPGRDDRDDHPRPGRDAGAGGCHRATRRLGHDRGRGRSGAVGGGDGGADRARGPPRRHHGVADDRAGHDRAGV
jgi:YD repeat-containing protein